MTLHNPRESTRRLAQVKLLREHLRQVEKSVLALQASIDKCRQLGDKSQYSLDELERFEALCARFARASDHYT